MAPKGFSIISSMPQTTKLRSKASNIGGGGGDPRRVVNIAILLNDLTRSAPPRGRRIQSLRAFRRTPLPAILCPDVPRDASEVSPRALKTPVGDCVLRPYGVRNGGKMCPKWLPGSLLELLGLLKASWSCLACLLGRSGRPLGRSWAGLGGLLERSWACLGRS